MGGHLVVEVDPAPESVQLGPCESCADDAGQPPATFECDGLCPRAEQNDGDEGCSVRLCDSCAEDHLAVHADPRVQAMLYVDALDTRRLACSIVEALKREHGLVLEGADMTVAELLVQRLVDDMHQDQLDDVEGVC